MSRYLIDEKAVADAVKLHTRRSYTVGLDLGQTTDPTALAVLERLQIPQLTIGRVPDPVPYDSHYIVRWIERLPLRMTYPDIVDHVGRLLNTAPLSSGYTKTRLVIDQTGVGRPVYDIFRKAQLNPVGITITGGDGWSLDGSSYRVSKLLLVSRAVVMLHQTGLHIAPGLPDAEVLKSELASFRRNYTANGYQQFEARSGRHDDLVLAVAIALWYATHMDGQVIRVGQLIWW